MDPRTTVLIGSITSGLMAVVLTLLARATPLPVPGLRRWVEGAWLAFLALMLLGLRDWVSNLASVTLGNAALMLAYMAWLSGTHEYLGARMRRSAWFAAWTFTILVVTWFIFAEESFRVRTVAVAGFCAIVCARHAFVLLNHPRADRYGKTIGVTLVASCQVALTAVYGVRCIHAFMLSQGELGLLTGDTTQVVYTAGFTVCNLVLVIGFSTMASDHVRTRIEEEALRDSLTGALNRRALFEVLKHEMSRSQRTGNSFCVAIIDIDFFKSINDRFGHPIGDRVLVHMCKRVLGLIRPHDVLARYGGEEFVIVMPETPMSAALPAAERLRIDMPTAPDAALPSITVSVGLAEWSSEDTSASTLIARADAALYQAKANGRNRVETG